MQLEYQVKPKGAKRGHCAAEPYIIFMSTSMEFIASPSLASP